MAFINEILESLLAVYGYGVIVFIVLAMILLLVPLALFLPPIIVFIIFALIVLTFGFYELVGISMLPESFLVLFVIMIGTILGFLVFKLFTK